MGILDPQPINKEQRLLGRIKALEKRISDLERTPLAFPQLASPPTNTPIDGSGAVVPSGPYLYVRIGGAWRRFVPG